MPKNSWLRLTLEAFPFYDFLEKMWQFICKPEIAGESLDNSSLRYSGQNFIKSLFLVTTITAFIQYLLPKLFEVDLGQLINPLYLTLILAIHAIVFAFILTITSSISLFPKKPVFHYLVAHQTIQTYAALNLLVVVMLWIGMNRILKTENLQAASSALDLWLGGGVGLIAFWLGWRLLVNPLWKYTAKHYARNSALWVTAVVLATSFWASSYDVFGK